MPIERSAHLVFYDDGTSLWPLCVYEDAAKLANIYNAEYGTGYFVRSISLYLASNHQTT